MDALRPAMRRRSLRLALLGLAWCLLSGHVFSGCKGLFTPAVPEPPTGKPIVVNYRSPEATLITMQAGIAAKGQGSTAWVGAFADSTRPEDKPAYHHFFAPGDVAVFEAACTCEAPSDWRAPQEQNFFQALLDVRPSDEYAMVMDSIVTLPDPPAEEAQAILYRSYQVLATSPDGNSTLIIARGYAYLTFSKKGADWLVTGWDDHPDPDTDPNDPYQLTLGRRRLESTR